MFDGVLKTISGLFSRNFWFGSFVPVAFVGALHLLIAELTFPGQIDVLAWFEGLDSSTLGTGLLLVLGLVVLAYAISPAIPLFRSLLDGSALPAWLHRWLRQGRFDEWEEIAETHQRALDDCATYGALLKETNDTLDRSMRLFAETWELARPPLDTTQFRKELATLTVGLTNVQKTFEGTDAAAAAAGEPQGAKKDPAGKRLKTLDAHKAEKLKAVAEALVEAKESTEDGKEIDEAGLREELISALAAFTAAPGHREGKRMVDPFLANEFREEIGSALRRFPIRLSQLSDADTKDVETVGMVRAFEHLRASFTELLRDSLDEAEHQLSVLPVRHRGHNMRKVSATRVGDARRESEHYCQASFGVSFSYLWPRLEHLLRRSNDPSLVSLSDARAQVEFSVLSFILLLTLPVWLPVLIWQSGPLWLFLILFLGTPLSLRMFYEVIVESQFAYGRAIESAMDLHRFDLMKALHLPLPKTLKDERDVWAAQAGMETDGPSDLTFDHGEAP